jgi:ABC-type Zn uptake system ZnuABC Zn-binding protein ZnuA
MRTATAVELIAASLAELRPETDWAARAAAYNTELMAVHAEMVALFETIPSERRRIITNHDSLGYLEARYGFEVIGTVIPGATTLAETNPRAFAQLIDLVVAEGVDVIFAENVDSTVLAEQLASEAVGRGDVTVRVVRIYTDALGQPGSGAESYLGMLRTTAQLLTDALAVA